MCHMYFRGFKIELSHNGDDDLFFRMCFLIRIPQGMVPPTGWGNKTHFWVINERKAKGRCNCSFLMALLSFTILYFIFLFANYVLIVVLFSILFFFFSGMTQGVIPSLIRKGVMGVSVGVNNQCPPPQVPAFFVWHYDGQSVLAAWHPGGFRYQ